MKKEIIFYDNHFLSVEAFQCFLEKNGYHKNFACHGTGDANEFENLISKKTSVAIINICGMPTTEALELPEKLLAINPQLSIIIISADPEVKMIKKFFEKGIKSFLTKTTDRQEFIHALEEVIAGKVYLTDDTKNALYNFICNTEHMEEKKLSRLEALTSREKEVLQHICEGLRTKEIADELFISTHTVESHRRNIMQKLEVRNTSMLVKYAMSNNLVN